MELEQITMLKKKKKKGTQSSLQMQVRPPSRFMGASRTPISRGWGRKAADLPMLLRSGPLRQPWSKSRSAEGILRAWPSGAGSHLTSRARAWGQGGEVLHLPTETKDPPFG